MRAAAAVGLAVSGGGKGTTAAGTVGSRSELGPGRTAADRCFSLLCGPGRTEAPSGGHSCFTSTAADGVGIGGGRGRGCGVTVTPVTAGGSKRAAFSCGSGGYREKIFFFEFFHVLDDSKKCLKKYDFFNCFELSKK